VKLYVLMEVDHCYECAESRVNLGAYTSLEGAQGDAELLHKKRYEEYRKPHHERQVEYWARQRYDRRGPKPVLEPFESLKWEKDTFTNRLDSSNYGNNFAIEEWETE
jgi:hypothetical protein